MGKLLSEARETLDFLMQIFRILKKPKYEPINTAELVTLNSWLKRNGFKVEEVSFSIYRNRYLMMDSSTLVIVGFGTSKGEATGYVVELAGSKVVEAKKIHPNAASYHKQVARSALYSGSTLLNSLVSKSLEMSLLNLSSEP